MADRSPKIWGIRTTLCALLTFLCCPVLCTSDSRPSIKLFGNISKFTNRSGLHDILSTNLFLTAFSKGDDGMVTRQDTIGDIYLQGEARSLGSHLRKISNEELGVTAMQGIYDKLPFAKSTLDASKHLSEIAEKFHKKLTEYIFLLNRSSDVVESLFRMRHRLGLSTVNPCCLIDPSILIMDNYFGTEVTNTTTCDTAPTSLPKGVFSPGPNITGVFRTNLQMHPSIKWQYFISSFGVHTEFPAYTTVRKWSCRHIDDLRHRDMYLATVRPYTKHVVIVIDHGNSLSPNQLMLAKAVGKYVLSVLSHHDKVGLIGLAAEAHIPQTDSCLMEGMADATYETKYHFGRFIDNLQKAPNSTNHRTGFKRAFDMISKSQKTGTNGSKEGEAVIVYVSRGLLSSIADARPVFETIASGQKLTGHRVVINTYTVVDNGKPIMYETSFLRDIAELNFMKYNVPSAPATGARGSMTVINSTENLGFTIGRFYSSLPFARPEATPVFSLPWWDSVSKDLLVSISKAVLYRGELLGVIGVDVPLADIAEDIIYSFKYPEIYSFLVDKSGVAVMHPSFPRPAQVSEQPMHTDISHLETRPKFSLVRHKMLNDSATEGRLAIASVLEPDNSDNLIEYEPVEHLSQVIYHWKKVENTPYIIAVVDVEPGKEHPELHGIQTSVPSDFYYHRLDILPPPRLCRHMKQLSTLSGSTVFLSARSFVSPFWYLNHKETRQRVEAYMAYLTDTASFVPNPGLKPGVKSDVLALTRITSDWKKTYENSEFTKHVVRRYVASPGGVFVVYPGAVLDQSYDPTEREWYTRALEHPGRVVLTAPYLDAGGAGYIVTLSHTIYEAKPDALHSTADAVVAVIGMDLTLGYFYKLLTVNMDVCEQDKIACFILDDHGYLIAHPSLTEPTGRGPVEQQHVTHKEPLVLNDMLNHKDLVRKKVCNSYSDRTIQRLYKFNTSLEGILSNSVHAEHCARYQITAISGTNAFLGIVNHTCNTVRAFCPCSMTDRLCLNCQRMEQTECECPCECPLQVSLCTGELVEDDERSANCPRITENPPLPQLEMTHLELLDKCFNSECGSRQTERDCFGVLGCEWCELDMDGITPLKTPFCHEQHKCFGGILGARTPYADEIIGEPSEELLTAKSTALGPVAGVLIGCFLLMAVMVYCYRNRVGRNTSAHYGMASRCGPLPMAHLYNESDDADGHGASSPVVPLNLQLGGNSYENRAVVSPYRVNTGYRRPAGGDSDHGYSTMTPHEDSEHLQYFEPLLLSKDKGRAPLPQPSFSSRASSPIHPLSWNSPSAPDPSQTYIPQSPQRNVFQASVQVHAVGTR
ncbi:VWFA and cache domain-containing protein 1-like [Ornithodoros turicata]|uniref:VWFA and cache domain-containing protein 1-like n=1 Tax=Ornithodoros turicata TaxID=34597 RepID=UPI00313933FC